MALLASARASFLADARELLGDAAADLTDDQIHFFTTVYYNGGAGQGRSLLERRGVDAARPWRGEDLDHNRSLRFNAAKRTATYHMVKEAGLFGD